jgi:long-chain-alcohol oxidase
MAAPAPEGKEEAAAAGHPLLRVLRRDKYTHGLRPVQMEALRAMCGALIPSLQPEEEEALDGRVDPPCGNKDLERFYLASGADSTVPDEVIDRPQLTHVLLCS